MGHKQVEWTDVMDRRLVKLVDANLRVYQIAEDMGVTDGVIRHRINKKKIKFRTVYGNGAFEAPAKPRLKPEEANRKFIQLLWKNHKEYYNIITTHQRTITR